MPNNNHLMKSIRETIRQLDYVLQYDLVLFGYDNTSIAASASNDEIQKVADNIRNGYVAPKLQVQRSISQLEDIRYVIEAFEPTMHDATILVLLIQAVDAETYVPRQAAVQECWDKLKPYVGSDGKDITVASSNTDLEDEINLAASAVPEAAEDDDSSLSEALDDFHTDS